LCCEEAGDNSQYHCVITGLFAAQGCSYKNRVGLTVDQAPGVKCFCAVPRAISRDR
jgi:hypothetical protein